MATAKPKKPAAKKVVKKVAAKKAPAKKPAAKKVVKKVAAKKAPAKKPAAKKVVKKVAKPAKPAEPVAQPRESNGKLAVERPLPPQPRSTFHFHKNESLHD